MNAKLISGCVVTSALLLSCGSPSRSGGATNAWSLVYWVPGPLSAAPGEVFMREQAAAGSTLSADLLLGKGTDVEAIGTHAPSSPQYRRVLLGMDGNDTVHDVGGTASELGTTWSWSQHNVGPALIDPQGTVYESRGGLAV